MNKPIPKNEEQRLQALQAYNILDTLPEKEIDDIVRLASDICGTPISMVSLVDKDRQWFKSKLGLADEQTKRDISFCQYTIMGTDVFEVPDARESEVFSNNPLVTGEPHVRFYAGAPLLTAEGHAIGSLCVLDRTPKHLSDVQKKSLSSLARFVMSHLELRRNRLELEKVKSQYHRMIENAGDIIYTSDPSGHFIYVSHAVKKILGYQPEELLGKHFNDLIPNDWREGVTYFYEQQFKSNTPETSLEFQIVTKDGRRIWVEQNVVLERDGTRVKGFQGVVRDISHRKLIELELEQARMLLLEAMRISKMAGFENHLNKRVIVFSPDLHEMLGLPLSSLALAYDSFLALIHPEDKENVKRHILEHKHSMPQEPVLARISVQGAPFKWLAIRLTGHESEAQELLKIRGTMQDISVQKQVEEQLREAKELAEESARAKEQFLANMSHEIRTPMNGVLGFSNLLLKMNLTGEVREYIEAIHSSGENLLGIINDILDYSKIEAGRMLVEEQPFELRQLFKSLTVMFSERARQKKLSLNLRVEEAVPQQLSGDEGHLTQILTNLIGNAIKFTEQGSVLVTASLDSIEQHRCFLKIVVADTGIGIPAEKLPTVFERFNQASNDTSRRYGGTGLGLSIVKKLAELNNAIITLRSEQGKGSQFELLIPYNVPEQQHKNSQVSDQTLGTFQKLNARVLLVEDHVLNQKLALKVLSDFGCQTDVAENGKKAIEQLTTKAYDLVLLDIQMPEMDGYETIGAIRNQLRLYIPVIAMTAHAMSSEREKCLALGMNDYISKPFQVEDFYEKIAMQLRSLTQIAEEHHARATSLNLSYLQRLSGGNEEFMSDILREFAVQVPPILVALQNAIQEKDYELIAGNAHKVKPSLAIVGLEALVPMLVEVEDLAKKREGLQRIEQHVRAVTSACFGAIQNIEKNWPKSM